MAVWKTIKNLFIPWNMITPSKGDEHEGVRTIEFGQVMVDGSTGDGITNLVPTFEHRETASPPPAQPTDRKS